MKPLFAVLLTLLATWNLQAQSIQWGKELNLGSSSNTDVQFSHINEDGFSGEAC